MNKISIILLFIFCSFEQYAQDVRLTLSNPKVVSENTDEYFFTDVMVYSNEGFKLGSGQLYFNYNPLAFGENVFSNNMLEIVYDEEHILSTKSDEMPPATNYYGNIVINDNTSSRFSFSWQQDFSSSCLEDNNANYYSDILFTVKLKFLSGQSNVNPTLCLENGISFIDQIFTSCGPNPCDVADCLSFPGTRVFSDHYSCSDCRIVYSKADSGVGTLREALSCSSPGDTIRFSPILKTDSIYLITNSLQIDKKVSVIAKKELSIFVSGEPNNKVFDILSGNTLFLEGINVLTNEMDNSIGIHNKGITTLKNVKIYYSLDGTNVRPILNEGLMNIQGTTEIKIKD